VNKMSVTLSEVKRAARAHRAPLAGESAGYLVLAIADQVLQAPRLIQADDVQLTEDGALRVLAGRASSDEDAERSLRSALDQLLLVASSGSAALTRASRRTAPVGLASLVRELEAALIPVNRSAARRALSRLHRETARALESGNLPAEVEPHPAESHAPAAATALAPSPAPVLEPARAASPAPVLEPAPVFEPVPSLEPAPVFEPVPSLEPAPVAAVLEPLLAEVREPNPEPELALELDRDLETPARAVPVLSVPLPTNVQTRLDGVLSALCDELPAPPQLVESDALTSALAVRAVPAPAPAAEPEPELLLDIDVEFETDAVDSSAAPTVMRAVVVETVEPPPHDAPLEAHTVPEPVMLRKTLRPLLDLLPKPLSADGEPVPETPTLGTLASQLPILAPEQIAEMSVAASLASAVAEETREEHTELMPEVLPLAPGVAMVESKKSDVNELLSSFRVAEPDVRDGLARAIKEMAELDLTPAPLAALIR
jgi:hypothetical protein